MERVEVVISRLPGPNAGVRTGALLERDRGLLLVKWDDDGQTEEVRLGGSTTFAVRGSLRHLSYVDPEGLRARLHEDPVSLIVQVLHEARTPLTALRIKEQLKVLRLDQADIDLAWKQVQPKLAKHDDVERSERAYVWKGKDDVIPALAEGEEPSAEPKPKSPAEEDSPADLEDEPLIGSDSVTVIQDATSSAFGIDPRSAITRPLRTGVSLARLSNTEIHRLVESVADADKPLMLTLLMARPRRTSLVDLTDRRAFLSREAATALVGSAVAEARDYGDAGDDGWEAAALWLLARLLDAEPERVPELTPVHDLALLAAVELPAKDLKILDEVVRALSDRLRKVESAERRNLDLDRLASLGSYLPFAAGGARTELLVLVLDLWPDSLTDARWWRNATAERVAESTTGAMRRVILRPDVADQVIAPLMQRELATVRSRSRLARLLSLPSEFVEHLPASDVAAAFRRAATDDPYAQAWLDALENKARVTVLSSELEQAHTREHSVLDQLELAREREQEMAARFAELEQRLQAQHGRAADLRSSQVRQIQIDTVRALADLAAEIEELASINTAGEVLVERVRGLLLTYKLEPIGEAGREVSFDWRLHEPLVGAPTEGEAVTVIRPGYRWSSDGDDVLLARAIVSVE